MVSEIDFVPQSFGGWFGYAAAAVIAVFAIMRDRRKADVDESAVILAAWKELMAGHKVDMAMLKAEFTAYKTSAIAEIDTLRVRLSTVEKEFAKYRLEAAAHIALRDKEIAGLQRAIAQHSQSTALYIERSSERMDEIEETEQVEHVEIHDRLDQLDEKGKGV